MTAWGWGYKRNRLHCLLCLLSLPHTTAAVGLWRSSVGSIYCDSNMVPHGLLFWVDSMFMPSYDFYSCLCIHLTPCEAAQCIFYSKCSKEYSKLELGHDYLKDKHCVVRDRGGGNSPELWKERVDQEYSCSPAQSKNLKGMCVLTSTAHPPSTPPPFHPTPFPHDPPDMLIKKLCPVCLFIQSNSVVINSQLPAVFTL